MTLFTQKQTEKLLANCQEQIVNNDVGHSDIDFKPVVKLFTPDAQYTWLLTELGNDDIAYGLCDLGMGTPEVGFVCMRELREARGPLGLPIERDLHFDANKTLSAYADEARADAPRARRPSVARRSLHAGGPRLRVVRWPYFYRRRGADSTNFPACLFSIKQRSTNALAAGCLGSAICSTALSSVMTAAASP
jgi:hypothetical protein